MRDRFFRLLKTWRAADGKIAKMSGKIEEVGEVERMLAEVDAEL